MLLFPCALARLATTRARIAQLSRAIHSVQHAAPLAAPATLSYIDRVKAQGATALLGAFLSTGNRFDRTMEGLVVQSFTPGAVTCALKVHDGLQNSYGTLHGGATCTIIDVAGTMALLTLDPTRAGVSVELSVSFLAAAKAGDEITIEARVLKSGKRLGFTTVDIYRSSDRALIASGRHTKAL